MTQLQYAVIALKILLEEAAFTSHIKGKKHVEKSHSDQCIKSLMPPTPAHHLIILKISSSGVSNSKLPTLIIMKIGLFEFPVVSYPLLSY